MKNKLKINKKSIMSLSKDSTKLSKEQQQQVAGGLFPIHPPTTPDKRSTFGCCAP